jgi:DNA mismatch repair protein MutS2
MIYPLDFEIKIGFDRIKEITSGYCLGAIGARNVENSVFCTNADEISVLIGQTSEFQRIIELENDFPADHYHDLSPTLSKIKIEGAYPELAELFDLKKSIGTHKSVFNFIKSRNSDKMLFPHLEEVIKGIALFPFIFDLCDRILSKDGSMKDNASSELFDIRKEIKKISTSVSRKLQTILKASQSEGIVEQGASISIRNGRGVIPVSAYDKNRIGGLIHDQSATGKTVYIEPSEIVAMNNRLVELEYSEKREMIKVLITVADALRPYISELINNGEILGVIDYIRARALLGRRLDSTCPGISNGPEIDWKEARHPLLYLAFQKTDGRKVEPLNIKLDSKNRILLISGPNAGGKSVCLKSVGLIQYMFQCGYSVPVAYGSRFGVFNSIFIDIGDDQSLENDLSTYSSHLQNMKNFLKSAGDDSLILIDEFGTGTEPMLGGAIAEAILADLNRKRVYGVITTHYTNLKHFASSEEGIINGAMMFDNHLMQPLFRLDIGKPGSSFAFEIARKIGLPEEILKHAADSIGEDHINFDRHLKDILRDKRYWENKRQDIRSSNKKLDELVEQYESEIKNLKVSKTEILSNARLEAESILNNANRVVESTIRQIKESNAEKDRTKEVRKELNLLRVSVKEDSKDNMEIENKIKKLKERESRVKSRTKSIKKTKSQEVKNSISNKPLTIGEYVVLDESTTPGEVVRINGKKITVAFDNISTTVEQSRLRRISSRERQSSNRKSRQSSNLDWDVTHRRSRFSPEKDIRGERADKALQLIQEMVDEATVVQYPTLRILHGKGDGILRQVIREYLLSVPHVLSFRDEDIESGGSGITVVELDV